MAEATSTVEITFTPEELLALKGSSWFVGSGPPDDSLGSDRDLYLDEQTGDIYRKENGSWA